MTQQEKIDAMEFENNRELMQGLLDAWKNTLVIPNAYLPERMHEHKSFEVGSLANDDGKVYGKTVARIEKILEKESEKKAFKQIKAEKAKRVEIYAAQVAETGEFQYEEMVDANMMNFLEKLAG